VKRPATRGAIAVLEVEPVATFASDRSVALAYVPPFWDDEQLSFRFVAFSGDTPVSVSATFYDGGLFVGHEARAAALSPSVAAVELFSSSISTGERCLWFLFVTDGVAVVQLGRFVPDYESIGEDTCGPWPIVARPPVLSMRGAGRWRFAGGRLLPD
jgi:hypothetical protein